MTFDSACSMALCDLDMRCRRDQLVFGGVVVMCLKYSCSGVIDDAMTPAVEHAVQYVGVDG